MTTEPAQPPSVSSLRHRAYTTAVCWLMQLIVTAGPLACSTVGWAQPVAAPRKRELSAVTRAWTDRGKLIRSARFTWRQDDLATGRWSSYQVTWPSGPDATSADGRDESLLLSGDKFRYEADRWYYRTDREFSGFNGSPADPAFYFPLDEAAHKPVRSGFLDALHARFLARDTHVRSPRRFTRIFDGRTFREVLAAGSIPHTEAAIYAGSGGQWPEDLTYRPVLLSIRPLSPLSATIDPADCVLADDDVLVNGFQCWHLREKTDQDIVRHYWIDPRRDFVIVRQIEEHGAVPAAQLDIRYAEHETCGWLPTGWTVMIMKGSADVEDYPGRQEVPCFLAATVTSAIVNEPVLAEEFSLEILPGTIVNDNVSNRCALALPDGGLQDLSPDDLLAIRQSSMASSWQRVSLQTWVMLIAVVLFAAAGAVKWRESVAARRSH